MKKKIKNDLFYVLTSVITVVIIMEFFLFNQKKRCSEILLGDNAIRHKIKEGDQIKFYDPYECPYCNSQNN